MHYLTTENAKTSKGESLGFLTGILYLAPSDLSGVVNVCQHASTGCRAACLYSAGRGAFSNVQNARIRKTREFAADPKLFVEKLADDITSLERMAMAQGLTPAVRLNGTSDLPWHRMGGHKGESLMSRFPSIQFYDYTKDAARALDYVNGLLPHNYKLTFSLSEVNREKAMALLQTKRINIAAVFALPKSVELPLFYRDVPVIDGDAHDLRFMDPTGCIVGLYAKGKATKDTSGFALSAE